MDNSKKQLLCVCDLTDHMGFSQSDLTKISNSVTGFLSKAVTHDVDSHTKWSGKLRQFSRQLKLLLGLHYPENGINSLFYFLFVSI